jgi:hypothetical protein
MPILDEAETNLKSYFVPTFTTFTTVTTVGSARGPGSFLDPAIGVGLKGDA